MKTVSSMEMEADGNVPNDLQVALILRDRLQKLLAGLLSGDELTELLSVLEIAAQEFGISVEKHVKYYKRRGKTKDIEGEGSKSVVCRHSCSSHTELLNPAVWSNLPHEVLRLVFARLSLCGIRGVKCLSKDWSTVVTTGSDYHRLCDAVHGSSFALVDISRRLGSFWVKVFNVKFNKWDTFQMVIKPPALAEPPKARATSPHTSLICGDEGLLCFISSLYFRSKLKRTRPSVFITVVNPLTGTSHELPPLHELCDIRMVELIVSSEMKGFKVFVLVDYVKGGTAEVYDSTKRSWGRAEGSLGFVFGKHRCLEGNFLRSEVITKGPCVYDVANGRLSRLGYFRSQVVDRDACMVSDARYKDRCFLLLTGRNGPANESLATQTYTYYIEEYLIQMPASTWVKVCTHRCAPFVRPASRSRGVYDVHLLACKGYLLVCACSTTYFSGGRGSVDRQFKLGWLYDLSSRKWRDLELPLLPLGMRTHNVDYKRFPAKAPEDRELYYHNYFVMEDVMCSLKWSA